MPGVVVFEVHQSQLCRPQYEKGQKVRVSKTGIQRNPSPTAVVKSVKSYGHTFEYDLAVDLEDVAQDNIVVVK